MLKKVVAEPSAESMALRESQWQGYRNDLWQKKDKKNVTVLFNYVERWKSFFFKAYLERKGFKSIDLGDHVKEDLSFGKTYGNRMQCNPLYFTSGSLLRNLFKIQERTGLTKKEIVEKYIFLGGGGQCGPCRYGMYPQEYLKVVNEAGFEGFRILIYSSDTNDNSLPKESALRFTLGFRINMLLAIVLADIMHVAECALRPYARDLGSLKQTLENCEKLLYRAFRSPFYLYQIPRALKKMSSELRKVMVNRRRLPLIFVTGEFFANLAHNDGNYNLRRFISDEHCEVIPGLMTQRVLYDVWRREQEALRGIAHAANGEEEKYWKKSLKKQRSARKIINYFARTYSKAVDLESFGGKMHFLDFEELARLGGTFYHPNIFGGEGHLEVAEAVHYADKVDGFISVKPFGCMPSSGVSDGVMAKITNMYPDLNFVSIETSGDNDVNILSRVSMLLFKAKQKLASDFGASVSKIHEEEAQDTLPSQKDLEATGA